MFSDIYLTIKEGTPQQDEDYFTTKKILTKIILQLTGI